MKKIYYLIFILIALIFLVTAQEITTKEENYIYEFMEKQGISNIKSIEKINKTLPSQIDISNVAENQIGVYGVTYDLNGIEKELFVISYSSEEFKEKAVETLLEKNYISFSQLGQINEGYLKSSYVMLNSGSITGLSTKADVTGNGKIIVEIHKNEKPLFLSNEFKENYDFDLQSRNLDTFEAGDVISIYVKFEGGISVENLNALILIE